MSENHYNTNSQDKTEKTDRPKYRIAPVVFNNVGKTPVSSTIVLTVNEMKDAIYDLAKAYFKNLTKERISVSLVADRNSTKYDKVTKTSRPTMAVVFAIYFDKNDANFVEPVQNVFAPMIKANSENANKFIKLFGAKDDNDRGDGKPFQPIFISKGNDGKTYRCLVLDVESIIVHIADGNGYNYRNQYGVEPPKVKIAVDIMQREESGNTVLEGFRITKELASATRTSFDNFRAAKIRGRVPRI